jgi:hypothetical protein
VQLRALVPEFTKAKYEQVAATAAKIIIVRHPLTRIVSAYRSVCVSACIFGFENIQRKHAEYRYSDVQL